MADNLTIQPTIPSRLREDNSALKATPRRGLAEVRLDRSVGQSTADKKTSRPFGGSRPPQTPSGLRLAHSAQRKTSRASHSLDIFEDPQQEARVSELVEKSSIESIAEEDEIETCDRDATKDVPSLLEEILDMQRYHSLPLITIKEDSNMMLNHDEDSTYSRDEVDSVEKDDEYETEERRGDGEMEERDEEAVRQYFVAPYGVGDAAKFEEQWSSLKVEVHKSDTEIENVAWGGEETEEREECSILDRTLGTLELDEPAQEFSPNYTDEDEDAKTIIFGEEEEGLSIDFGDLTADSDWSDEEEMDEEDEVGDRIRQYFLSPYGVGDAARFEAQWSSLNIEAHDSDTEIEYCTATSHRDATFDLDDLVV